MNVDCQRVETKHKHLVIDEPREMSDAAHENAPDGKRTRKVALAEPVRAKIGEELEEMGYEVVEITLDDETGEPRIPEDVDAFFMMSLPGAMFNKPNSMLSEEERERKMEVGKSVLLPRVKSGGWVHVPSAGLNHVSKIFEETSFVTGKAVQVGGEERGIRLTHNPGVQGLPMAEYVVAHVLSIAKKIPKHIEMQKAHIWEKVTQRSPSRDTIGILGCGGIGMHTAKLIRAFGIRILATKRSVTSHIITAEAGSEQSEASGLSGSEMSLVDEWFPSDDESMMEVFKRSTYVVCCLPLTPTTGACITTRHFEALGGDGFFINVSRGDVVDQDALIAALESETIAGAVLDVVSPEPLPVGHKLWDCKNCHITAHDSWKTTESVDRIYENFLDNARRFIAEDDMVAEVVDLHRSISFNKIEIS